MSSFHARHALRMTAVTALMLVAAPSAGAQTLPPDSAIHAIVQARVDSARAPGIVVGVLEDGRARYFAYGSAGPGRDTLDEHTLFEIGSISKVFNALLLADAAVRGAARLDQPVRELLPPGTVVPTRDGRDITLEQLATHRSGLPRLPGNMAPANLADPYADYDVERLYAFLEDYVLPRVPGEGAEYSNLGAGLLGHALVYNSGEASWGAVV
jgi:serine-type D-Ala-D-Ala carboxypeptidase/endopeptidase